MSTKNTDNSAREVRLDKWLWAARFFKTRALAKQAIEGGKVHYNGNRGKSSKAVEAGALLQIRQGFDEKTVEVLVLSEQRRSASEAQLLYQETEESQKLRALHTEQRRATNAAGLGGDSRPNKRDRRRIQEFKEGW